ncbi:MAG: selenocysteine-specific translation elongation factor [Promethearchaeota archaeon]
MDLKDKIPIHVGLFGHIDSGKTAVAARLSEIISTAGIDAHPQSKERGITIDLGFTSFSFEKYIITLVDGPGHADLIKISASSIEIIDLAIIVIDINKGPQVQTGEHIIMIESLNIQKIIVVLNKIDIFRGDLKTQIEKIRDFFATTSFGPDIPIFAVSAKNEKGIDELKQGIVEIVKNLQIKRDVEGALVIPIDHHFLIKGMGAIITGTILKGQLKIGQNIDILPINAQGRVKSIEVFHENVNSAKAGDRVGINLKNVDVKKVYRGCIATDDKNSFNFCEIVEVIVNNNKLFKSDTRFGTQVHVTIGMNTIAANIYPYYELNEKRIQTTIKNKGEEFKAFLWFNDKVLIQKERNIMLISRLDLPPTTLRILGSARLIKVHDKADPPIIFKYKMKQGRVKNPDHSQGIVCVGLAQSAIGAKKIVGKKLEPPFTKILETFGTKGAVIVGVESKVDVKINEAVILKELRSFRLKKI